MIWRAGSFAIDLSRPRIMGILNVTPDSFSDGGRHLSPFEAARRAERMVAEGVDVIDVGGESTRPGAEPVTADQEMIRVLPVIREVARHGVPVSVDTAKPAVAAAALAAGAVIVNDVTALGDPDMAGVVAGRGAGVVLMHMKGSPRTMQEAPEYEDLLGEIASFLEERRARAENQGIGSDRIVFDPGIGFGKTLEHNLTLLARIDRIAALGSPVLVGASRKSFVGRLAGVEAPAERGPGSLAAAVLALAGGARLFRVHDVAATRQALTVASAILAAR